MNDQEISDPNQVPGFLCNEKLDNILTEISMYEIKLEEDPTLPDLGSRYIQSKIAICRQYLNRTQYYLQILKRYEINLKRAEKTFELDLEIKISEKLADDMLVRQQPAQQERKALALSMLKSEHENLAIFKVELQGLDGVIRIVKSRYDDLRYTNQDIKLQRQLIKDDRSGWENDGSGYIKPQSRENGIITGGLPPPVSSEKIDPRDLLDPDKRPEDLPEPKNDSHARQISDFYANQSMNDQKNIKDSSEIEPVITGISYNDLLVD